MASLPSVTVVSDTSPISYSVLTRIEEVIPELYGEVLVPDSSPGVSSSGRPRGCSRANFRFSRLDQGRNRRFRQRGTISG